MIVISDTSPIRGLISIDRIELLHKIFYYVNIPEAVRNELLQINTLKDQITFFLNQSWVSIKKITEEKKLEHLLKYLDRGESEAIILAKEIGADLLLIDESKGRKIAKSLNVDTLGLIGVLVIAKRKGFITDVKPHLDLLINKTGFWIGQKFYNEVLKSVNEL